MHQEILKFPPEMHRILTRMKVQSGQIMGEYLNARPQESHEEFKQKIFNPTLEFLENCSDISTLLDDTSSLEKLSNFIAGDQNELELDVAFLHFSCLFSAAAMFALDARDRDLAWDLVGRAEYFLGATMYTNRGEQIATDTIRGLYKSEIGVKGGKIRAEQENAASKDIVYRTVQARESWDSLSKAVIEAKKALEAEELARPKNPNSKEKTLHRAEETIELWIKQKPELLEKIPSYISRRNAQQQRPAQNQEPQSAPLITSIWSLGEASGRGGLAARP